ncbi:MAG: putative methyltransferase, partial [Phaeoacremonium minimum tetramycovirus 1]
MLQRRHQGRVPVRPERPTRRESISPEDVRAKSTAPSGVSVALSSRSRTSVMRTFKTANSTSVDLPYTLFEFGFPSGPLPPLDDNPQFSDPAGIAFMSSEAGDQLRRAEHFYAVTTRQFITRSVRLASAHLLVIGSGSSREMIPIVSRGVASVTFVDLSQHALDRLQRNMHEQGLTAVCEMEFVCADAWDFLGAAADSAYDVCMATKCIGAILSAPGRTVSDFFQLVEGVLGPDGSFFGDHHMAFSDPSIAGATIGSVCDPALYDLATIAGRYAHDVCFSLADCHSLLQQVGTFTSDRATHHVQSWQFFHYRMPAVRPVDHRPVLAEYRHPFPATFDDPENNDVLDQAVEAMMPLNAKGVKRVPTPSDVGAFPIEDVRLKFDGAPGILTVDGNVGLFLSPMTSFVVPLSRNISPILTLTAEIVTPADGRACIVVTGLAAIGETPTDPLDGAALSHVAPVVDKLAPDGIICSTPMMVRSLVGDTVKLSGPAGRVLFLPVDGIQ